MPVLLVVLLVLLVACDRLGLDRGGGAELRIQITTGTILNRNYTEGNPKLVSVPLTNSPTEPTVLSFGVENNSGIYVMDPDFSVIAVGRYRGDYSVSGYEGWWYALVKDRRKKLVGKNYRVKFVQ